MNPLVAENEFRAGLEKVLADIDHQLSPDTANPHASARDEVFHERDTRVFFFDRLLELLGWDLGSGGNVEQEARIKADTTKFVDYVGVNPDTRAPVLVLEAKAWDKPIISGRGRWRRQPRRDLIVAAINHINEDGCKKTSPVTAEWHKDLSQLAGYVRKYKERYRHSVSCAVLSSGQWMLVFKEPVSTFCNFDVNDQQFHLFERNAYVANANLIFEQMARVNLADVAPFPIRSSQLRNHVTEANFSAAYHGLLVHYEASGSSLIAQMPRILVYPSIIIQRDDVALFTVIDAKVPIEMPSSRSNNGKTPIVEHVQKVAKAAKELLQSCSDELGLPLKPSELAKFPGFKEGSVMAVAGLSLDKPQKFLAKLARPATDNWLAVTGSQPHYLLATPTVVCRFHGWAACSAIDKSIGSYAINSPAIRDPRAFFVDNQPHHCAHQTVIDRRDVRCYIKAIDARTCCKACVYQDTCWSPHEAANLPCGS